MADLGIARVEAELGEEGRGVLGDPLLRPGEHADQLVRQLMLEGQQAAADDRLAAHLDDAHGEPVPGPDRLGGGVLAHADRLAAPQQVAGEDWPGWMSLTS